MNNQEKLSKLKDEDYQELFGVKKPTFDKMLEILEAAYQEQSRKGGRPLRSLSVLDKLVIMLQYYREYRTMQHIAFDFPSIGFKPPAFSRSAFSSIFCGKGVNCMMR